MAARWGGRGERFRCGCTTTSDSHVLGNILSSRRRLTCRQLGPVFEGASRCSRAWSRSALSLSLGTSEIHALGLVSCLMSPLQLDLECHAMRPTVPLLAPQNFFLTVAHCLFDFIYEQCFRSGCSRLCHRLHICIFFPDQWSTRQEDLQHFEFCHVFTVLYTVLPTPERGLRCWMLFSMVIFFLNWKRHPLRASSGSALPSVWLPMTTRG